MNNKESGPETSLNISISAYRVLYILLVLVRYRSLNMVELNRMLSENPLIGRAYSSETLTKYVNTLREVGCQIPRSSIRSDYCYDLLKSPFPMSLSPDELSIVEKLLSLLAVQSDEMLYRDCRDVLEHLFWAVDADWLAPEEEQTFLAIPELSRRRDLLNRYRQYCQDAFTLELVCRDQASGHEALPPLPSDNEDALILLEPYEVVERGKQIFLLGLDRQAQQQRMLDVEHILSVRQLPSKNRRPVTQITVVFALYGRLAKSYRLYPGERIIYRSNTEIQVKCRVTEAAGLIQRLLKYGTSCQVLSPEVLRESLRCHIECLVRSLNASDIPPAC